MNENPNIMLEIVEMVSNMGGSISAHPMVPGSRIIVITINGTNYGFGPAEYQGLVDCCESCLKAIEEDIQAENLISGTPGS